MNTGDLAGSGRAPGSPSTEGPPAPALGALEFHWVEQHHLLVRPLLEDLALEYSARYGYRPDEQLAELTAYPGQEFAPPGGGLVVASTNGEPVAGGAFRRYAEGIAELKRIWTESRLRNQGLGKRVLAALEREIAARGYPLVVLTTGPLQPEAVGLYLSSGYTPLFDVHDRPAAGPLPFRKELAPVPSSIEARLSPPFAQARPNGLP